MSKRRKGKIAILLIITIFVIIAVIGLYQNPAHSWTAQDYFQVTEAGITTGYPQSNGSVYIVYVLSITLKAVHGDAHEVMIQSWGNGDSQLIGTMSKDVPTTISLSSPRGVILKRSDGFRTEITIRSAEASGPVSFPVSE